MNKIIRNILISLAIIAVLASAAGNIYYFGWKKLEANLLQKGFDIAVSQIIQSVQQIGQVQLGEDLILIKK
jgi:Na+-translocating ferredoxin:NAD+ oxidoreductase RnfD subunit